MLWRRLLTSHLQLRDSPTPTHASFPVFYPIVNVPVNIFCPVTKNTISLRSSSSFVFCSKLILASPDSICFVTLSFLGGDLRWRFSPKIWNVCQEFNVLLPICGGDGNRSCLKTFSSERTQRHHRFKTHPSASTTNRNVENVRTKASVVKLALFNRIPTSPWYF